jgi:hypothetical protein
MIVAAHTHIAKTGTRWRAAILIASALGVAGCHSAKQTERKPLFVGTPKISELQPGARTLMSLGAPLPTVKRLNFTIRTKASGKIIGASTETLKAAGAGYAELLEDTAYRIAGGQCNISSRSEAVGVGGFLALLEAAHIWSPDCPRLAGGRDRRAVIDARISGQLFPLRVGNQASVHYTVLGSDSDEDTGFATYDETLDESYQVVERIADFRAGNGKSVGEVFRIQTSLTTSRGKKRAYEFLFSTALGWRVGYRTDLEAILIDWLQ